MTRAQHAVVLAALVAALCIGTTFAACPMGTEASKPGGPCDRCSDFYAGKPPNCKPCELFFGQTIRKKDGTNVCECSQGYSGVYPKCTSCPSGTDTESAGNGNKCGCTQPKDSIYSAVRVSCPACNAKTGWYERAVYTNASTFKYPPGKVCLYCKETDSQKGLVVKGGKCACDTGKKFGFALEYRGFTSAMTICQKCDGTGNTALAKDGRCLCKKGYGVVPYLGFTYCIKCDNGKVTKEGFCICNKGYAYGYDTSRCMKCNGPRFELRKDGKCYCGKGYAGSTQFVDGKLLGCDKCPSADFTTVLAPNSENACVCKGKRKGRAYANANDFTPKSCVCRWGFQPKGADCEYNAFCAKKQYKVEYWVGSKLPGWFDGAAFPAKDLEKVKPTVTATVAAADWKEGAWPSLPAAAKAGKFAARITRCVCLQHKDWDTQFKYAVVKGAKGTARLVIDGGQTERRTGDLYDENVNSRPGVVLNLPFQAVATAGKAATVRVLAPQYAPRAGGWLSGFDSIPMIRDYEACHKVEVLYASANGAGALKVVLPTKPEP